MSVEKRSGAVEPAATGPAAGEAPERKARTELPVPERVTVSAVPGKVIAEAWYTVHGYAVKVRAEAEAKTDNVYNVARRLYEAVRATRWAVKHLTEDIDHVLAELAEEAKTVRVGAGLVAELAKKHNDHDRVYDVRVTVTVHA